MVLFLKKEINDCDEIANKLFILGYRKRSMGSRIQEVIFSFSLFHLSKSEKSCLGLTVSI